MSRLRNSAAKVCSLVVVLTIMLRLPASVAAQPAPVAAQAVVPVGLLPAVMTVQELTSTADAFDGLGVTVHGEIVGDIMHRGHVTWINVNDGTGTIGIWGRPELFAVARHAGAYAHRGDTVAVSGVFHRSSLQQGGDLAIEADQFTVVSVGGPVDRPVDRRRLQLALVATALTAVLGGLLLLRRLRLRGASSGPM